MRASDESHSRLAAGLSVLFIVGLSLAIALFVAGAVLAVVKPEATISASSIAALPGAVAALEPGGFFDLGLLVLLAIPAARVATLLVAFARRRLWLFSGLSFVVLVVLALGAFLGVRGS